MNYFKNYILLLLCIIGLGSSNIDAQEDKTLSAKETNLKNAYEHCKNLREGTLVIRLRSGANKTQKLRLALADNNLKKKQRKYLESELEEHLDNIATTNDYIAKAFTENYEFSKFLFIYDTASVHLYKGKKSGFFLDKTLEVDKTIQLETSTFYTCDYKRVDNTKELEGLVIQDLKKEVLAYPFPSKTAIPVNPGKIVWNSLLGKNSETQLLSKSVIRLNKRLIKLIERGEKKFD